MDVTVITTYRCNSKCSMCFIWQNPTLPKEEVSLATLNKIPKGIDYLNLTGGEPTLRDDLMEIVDLLNPKAMKLEISSNGSHGKRLDPIVKKYPNTKIRFSLDGVGLTNDEIRGERNGFENKVKGLLRLKELGGNDLGFGVTIQDDNAHQLVDLFRLSQKYGVELGSSTLHNGFQFHKNNNVPYDRIKVAKYIEDFIVEQLKTNDIKTWFRAYLNLGLIAKVLGQERILPCTAATNFTFVDPWSDMYACNVRPDLKLGNLVDQSWDEIINSPRATDVRQKVVNCKQNCWMVGSAKTAMRNPHFVKIPKGGPLLWVVENKLRTMLGLRPSFEKSIDFSNVHQDTEVQVRKSYLNLAMKRKLQTKEDIHYTQIGKFENK